METANYLLKKQQDATFEQDMCHTRQYMAYQMKRFFFYVKYQFVGPSTPASTPKQAKKHM